MNIGFCKKYVVGMMIVAILFSGVFAAQPKRAEAWWGIIDTSLDIPNWIQNAWTYVSTSKGWIKENVLDPLAWYAAKAMIRKITDGLVTWINSGFEGNPVFIGNTGDFFGDLANQATGMFINKLGAENLLCGNFKPQILLSFAYKKPYMQKFKCTLNDAIENWDDFSRDFKAGGWKGWMSVSTQAQNNPIGSYLMARDELSLRVSAKTEGAGKEINWGGGFMSMKKCSADIDFDVVKGNYCEDNCADLKDVKNNDYGEYMVCVENCNNDMDSSDFSKEEQCKSSGGQMQNTTPGKIIESRLSKSLGMDLESLGVADEISEIISALINQMFASDKGLRGVSGPLYSSTGGTPSESVKAEMADTIVKNTSYEVKYRDAKQSSLNSYNWAIGEVEKLKQCYESQIEALQRKKEKLEEQLILERSASKKTAIQAEIDAIDEEIASLRDKINNEAQPLIDDFEGKKAPLEEEVQKSNEIIIKIESVKQQILSAGSYEEMQKIYEQVESAHSPQDQIDAEEESRAVENETKKLIEGRDYRAAGGPAVEGGSGGIKGQYLQCSADLKLLLEEERNPSESDGEQNP